MSNPAPDTGKVLAAKPQPFDGSPSKYRKFKRDLSLYLIAAKAQLKTVEDKILFTLSYMTGDADPWKESFIKDHLSTDALTPANYTWAEFINELDAQWKEEDEARTAREKLDRYYQGKKKAVDFFLEFKRLRSEAGYTNAVHETQMIEWIENHSDPDLIQKVYNSGVVPTTVDDYITKITNLDKLARRLAELQARRKSFWKPAGLPAAQQNANPGASAPAPTSTAPNMAQKPAPGRPVPMDIDRKATRDARFKAGLCMECGKAWPCAEHLKRRERAAGTATTTPTTKTRAQLLQEARALIMANAGDDDDLQTISAILQDKDF